MIQVRNDTVCLIKLKNAKILFIYSNEIINDHTKKKEDHYERKQLLNVPKLIKKAS